MTTTSQADNTNGTHAPTNNSNNHNNAVGGIVNDNSNGSGIGSVAGVGIGVGVGIPTKTIGQQQQQSTNSNTNATTNGATSSQRGGESNIKRKKLKSRNASGSGGGGGGGSSGYAKDHLDAWLENCLRDAANTQLSSSSEFLDFNPTMNRANFMQSLQQPQQQQQQPLQQQQQQHIMSSTPQQNHQPQQQQMSNLHNFNPQQQQQATTAAAAVATAQQQQQHSMSQQQFLLRSNSQPYSIGGGGNGGYNAPFSLGIQRHTPSYMRSTNSLSNRYPLMFPAATNGIGGGGSGVGGGLYYGQNDASQDFASLPPIVNMLSGLGNSENEQNSTDVLDGSNSNPNINRGFRFSDPCLLNPSDNDSKLSGQNTPDRRTAMPSSNDMENNKFFAALMEQINILHETNSKICRNLHETKVDIEALKHTPTSWGGGGIGMRHRRDSLSGLSTQSQPLAFGGGFGTQSPAPTFHSAYAPGMMTDVVREVKEAARVREDALLNRVKSMVEERQWSMNEGNVRILRDIDELKTYVLHLRLERKEINKRLNHLEAENRYMRQLLASLYNNRNAPDIIYENEALRTRKSSSSAAATAYANSRRTQSFNLHYGTIHQQPLTSGVGVGGIGSGTTATVDDEEQQQQQQQQLDESVDVLSNASAQRATDLRNSFSSTDSCIGSSSQAALSNKPTAMTTTPTPMTSCTAQMPSPPNFALISKEENQQQQLQQHQLQKKQTTRNKNANNEQEKDASDKEQLKRELHEAVTARNEADQRIIALEKLVSSLALGAGQTIDTMIQPSNNNNITNGIGGGLVRNFNDSAPAAAAATTNVVSMWSTYPQQQQQQQQPQLQQHSHSINSTAVYASTLTPYTSNNISSKVNANNNGAGIAPKLSVAGPITDL